MAYVIIRTGNVYVADMNKSTTGGSYTNKLQYAKVFATREEAERDRCPGNERVVDLSEAMR